MRSIFVKPNIETELPRTDCDTITFYYINNGDSDLFECILKIGEHNVVFKAGDYKMKSMLSVDGNPDAIAVVDVWKNTGNNITVLLSPMELSQPMDDVEIQVYFQYSYSDPKG